MQDETKRIAVVLRCEKSAAYTVGREIPFTFTDLTEKFLDDRPTQHVRSKRGALPGFVLGVRDGREGLCSFCAPSLEQMKRDLPHWFDRANEVWTVRGYVYEARNK